MSSSAGGPHIRASARAGQAEESEPLNPSSSTNPATSSELKRPLRDRRFDNPMREKVPFASIALALFLLFVGTACFIIAYLIHQGHTAGQDGQAISFCIVGLITILPGNSGWTTGLNRILF